MKVFNLSFVSPVVLSLCLSACGGGGSESPSTPTQPQGNISPTVDAGSTQSVDEKTEVSLTGTATDSDGSIASYSWTQSGGTEVVLSATDSANVSFTAPEVTANESLTFSLTVTDNEGATKTDSIIVNVNNINILPTVNAGDDQSVNKSTTVTLNGVASDEDGTISQYHWVQTGGTNVSLENSDTVSASFTPSNLTQDETLIFQLTVTDNNGDEASDSVSVMVVIDSSPELFSDKTLVEVSPSSSGEIVFTAVDDITSEGDLYNSLTLLCDRDPNETFSISIAYSEIHFYTSSTKPDYEEQCIASVTDSLGQQAQVSFSLIKTDTLPAEKITLDGSAIITPENSVVINITGELNSYGVELSTIDSEFNDIENILDLSYANKQITVSISDDVEIPEDGTVILVGAQVFSDSGNPSATYFHYIRLMSDGVIYDEFTTAFDRAMNEFTHSQDYYYLKTFMLDYAQNNKIITKEVYDEQLSSTYAPSTGEVIGLYQSESAVNNLANYLPSEVVELTEQLNSNDASRFDFSSFYWDLARFIEQYPLAQFPNIPDVHTKNELADNSYSYFIGDTTIGSFVDNQWIFNSDYEYLQAVVDMKYWYNVDEEEEVSGLNEQQVRLLSRSDKDTLSKIVKNDVVTYPLGFRSKTKILPPRSKKKSLVASLEVAEPVFNDPYFKDQLWMKEQPTYKGAQSLLKLKESFTETRTSRIAVIDGNFIPTNEINFTEGFDAVEMDNDPYVNFEESKEGSYAFHGMAVASVIGAISNNNYGIAGALSNVEIVPIRVFENGSTGYGSDAANGIRWAAGYSFEDIEDISAPVDVINLSLGSRTSCDSNYQSAIDYALEKGVIVVASSGNDSTNVANAPSNCHGVISVAANDINGKLASFSNYDINGGIDASAVGIEVAVLDIIIGETEFEETFSLWEGTSFSGPIVASVLALIKQNLDDYPTALAQQHIKNSSGPFKGVCLDCGPGVTNADEAVNSAVTQPVKLTANIVNKYQNYSQGYKQDYLQAQINAGADACYWWDVELDNDVVFEADYSLKLSNTTLEYSLGGVTNSFYDAALDEVSLELCTATSCIASLETTNQKSKPSICE